MQKKGVAAPFLFSNKRKSEMSKMTITELWYLIIFAWGIACGWAVIKGIDNQF